MTLSYAYLSQMFSRCSFLGNEKKYIYFIFLKWISDQSGKVPAFTTAPIAA